MRDREEEAEPTLLVASLESTLAEASSTQNPVPRVVLNMTFWLIVVAVFVLVLAAAGYYDRYARRRNSGYPRSTEPDLHGPYPPNKLRDWD